MRDRRSAIPPESGAKHAERSRLFESVRKVEREAAAQRDTDKAGQVVSGKSILFAGWHGACHGLRKCLDRCRGQLRVALKICGQFAEIEHGIAVQACGVDLDLSDDAGAGLVWAADVIDGGK